MGKDIWVGMMTSEDITVESDTMVGEPEVKLIAGGAAAVVVYTTHSKFTYKGTANDDIAKFSLMLEKQADARRLVEDRPRPPRCGPEARRERVTAC